MIQFSELPFEAERGKAAFKFRESAAHDENAKYIGRLDHDPMPRKRYEITIEGEDQELEPFKKLCKDGTARKINRRKMPDGRIRLTLDLPTEQPLDASQFAKETRFISIAKDDKLREGVCIYLKDTTQSKQIAEAIENDEMLRNRATRESPKWFQLGGNIADITKKLHQKRQEGNITSDVSYRAWTVSDDSTITIWCGMIDGTGEDWVEVKAKVEERVDTEIANKIMRALGICFKTEETRVETELINGKAIRKMIATVSKQSAEQVAGMTFTAHDEGSITPIKVIFGGKTGAEPIDVDGSDKEKRDIADEFEDADMTPSAPKNETPKTDRRGRRSERKPKQTKARMLFKRKPCDKEPIANTRDTPSKPETSFARQCSTKSMENITPSDWQNSMKMDGLRIK